LPYYWYLDPARQALAQTKKALAFNRKKKLTWRKGVLVCGGTNRQAATFPRALSLLQGSFWLSQWRSQSRAERSYGM
jgi:hypothetical protein